MAHYKGTAQDAGRAKAMAAQREQQAVAFKSTTEELKKESKSGLKKMDDMFTSKTGIMEEQFKAATVGLVSAQEFKAKRLMIEQMIQQEHDKKAAEQMKLKKRKENERKKKLKTLSFAVDDEEEEQVHDEVETEEKDAKRRKMFKNPDVDTSFLPDAEREAEEERLRKQLEQEWKQKQEQTKSEQIEIVFSYWDGAGHRKKLTMKKGARIDQFLEAARKDLMEQFHELRAISSEGMIYVKEDLIIPHHFSFYDLIITKARGKSGPLFHFDVHDDVRLLADASIEKDESHAGKILTRAWYDRNKHIFPASRWEVYDPAVKWDKYTIHGGEVNGKQ